MTYTLILQMVDNLINPEALTISGLLVSYIWLLRGELKDQSTRYRETIKQLIEKNDRLQEEKYKVTREVIPLLVDLLDKLNKENKHE